MQIRTRNEKLFKNLIPGKFYFSFFIFCHLLALSLLQKFGGGSVHTKDIQPIAVALQKMVHRREFVAEFFNNFLKVQKHSRVGSLSQPTPKTRGLFKAIVQNVLSTLPCTLKNYNFETEFNTDRKIMYGFQRVHSYYEHWSILTICVQIQSRHEILSVSYSFNRRAEVKDLPGRVCRYRSE